MSDEVVIPSREPVTTRQGAARLAFAAALVALALWTFAEYLPALGWAGVIAIATWPFYKRLRERAGHGGLRSAMPVLFALGVGLVVLAPLAGAGWFVGREAQAAAHWLQEARKNGIPVPEGLESLKLVGPYVASWWRDNLADPDNLSMLGRGVNKIAMSEKLGSAALRRLVVFLFTILALFFMYRDGDSLAVKLGRLSERAFGPRGPEIGARIVNSVHGTVDGLVLVGLGEGLALTIAYYALGVPQWLLLGAATAIGAIVPFGAFVMFSLAALLLIYKGAMAGAAIIFVLGLVVLTVADHVVRPYVIGNATRLPFLFVLVGILGGVEAFGMLGPVPRPRDHGGAGRSLERSHGPCGDGLGEQAARQLRRPHPLDADRHRRRAGRDAVGVGARDDLVPGALQRPLQPVHHLLARPEILLEVLHPFEIADDDAAGVAQNVGHDEHVAARGQHLVGFRRGRAVGALGDDAALQLGGDLGVDHALDGAGREHVAGQGQRLSRARPRRNRRSPSARRAWPRRRPPPPHRGPWGRAARWCDR